MRLLMLGNPQLLDSKRNLKALFCSRNPMSVDHQRRSNSSRWVKDEQRQLTSSLRVAAAFGRHVACFLSALQVFHSIQRTCMELLKVTEQYQRRICSKSEDCTDICERRLNHAGVQGHLHTPVKAAQVDRWSWTVQALETC